MKYVKEDPDMSLGEMLHRLGSAIGLYPEDRSRYEYDDYDDPYAEDDYSEDEPLRGSSRASAARYSTRNTSSRTSKPGARSAYASQSASAGSYESVPPRRPDNVVQMPQRNIRESSSSVPESTYTSPAPPSTRHSEIIVYVRRKDDAQQIIGYVLEERSVILNCESIDDAQCQRVIDMLGGAAYAIGGHVQRVSHRNYLFAPANVEVSSSDSAPASASRYGG